MKSFKYTAATSAAQASKLLGGNAVALAGGSNLLNLMKEHVVEPDVVVDLKSIGGLDSVAPDGDGLSIGANVTLTALLKNAAVARDYPALHQAAAAIATPQIRNRATVGGNLCARPSCWYYAHGNFDCAKKGAGGCPAKTGENEFHAIFDTSSPCVMVHPSSLAPALIALGAEVELADANGSSRMPLESFFASPSSDVTRENVARPDQIVTRVVVGPARANSATYDVRQKAAHDWPITLASVALEMSFGTCKDARVCLGAVAPTPKRATGAESALRGKRVTAEVARAAAAAAVAGAQPLSQNAYKVTATRTAVERAVLVAANGAWH